MSPINIDHLYVHVLGHLYEKRALGVKWDIQTSTIGFHIILLENPSARSGLLFFGHAHPKQSLTCSTDAAD